MKTYIWHNDIEEPSDFAKSLNYKEKRILDLGCGNGRDTKYFRKNNRIYGVDIDLKKYVWQTYEYDQIDISEFLKKYPDGLDCDVVYCRFLFHAISEKLEDKIIKWSFKNANELAIEARAKGDKPILYTDHERRLIDPVQLIKKLDKVGFKNIDLKLGHGFAKLKDEDPYIIRVIAKK